jgi:AcrR family transcriptional regulator
MKLARMTRRKTGDDRRETIIAAACDLLVMKGLAASTTRDVTSHAGIGVGLLNHYFAWAELRATALDRVLHADIETRLPGARVGDPVAILEGFVEQAFAERLDPIWRLWIEGFDLATHDPQIAAVLARNAGLAHDRMASLFEWGHASGRWTCEDPRSGAIRVSAMQDGLIGLILTGSELLSRAEASRHLWVAAARECGLPTSPPPASP